MQLKPRFQAAGIHLCISLVIAALAATLVFALWYPYPYRDLSGGRELFTMLVSIDVILGPLLTLAVFNLKKPRAELVRDLAIIGLVQLLALGYGLWTVYQARPVHMVFEMDRFRVTHAADIDPELLAKAPPSANTEFGVLARTILLMGMAVMARLRLGLSSTSSPLASSTCTWARESSIFCTETVPTSSPAPSTTTMSS